MSSKTLTKDIIFSNTTAENIYAKFLNFTALPKGNISSPFSKDEKPSFKVYKNGTFKCNSTGKQGDVFQFVADIKQLDCKRQFNEVLRIIAFEMNLTNENNPLQRPLQQPLQHVVETIETNDAPFKIEELLVVEMENVHFDYWQNIGVNNELLQRFNVIAITGYKYFSTKSNKIETWNFRNNAIAFAYELNGKFEVYSPAQPEKKSNKHLCNGTDGGDIYGLDQLGNSLIENLIICAGKKDTIVATSRGFKAVTFRSETHNPTQQQIEELQRRCNNLFICYDNDKGGDNGKKSIIAKYPFIIPLQLPTNEKIIGYDVTDYFQEYTSADFQNIIDLAVKEKNPEAKTDSLTTIFHIAENYLKENYEFRYNTISLAIESTKKNSNEWLPCNENSLWLELQKKSIKVPLNSLIAILKSDFVPVYNPLLTYFENLPKWDNKTDYIQKFSSYVILEENESREQFEYHFKKWCVRVVKCATIDNYFNKQAFILTDDGVGQNIGKTSWCRFLCPPILSEYIAQDIPENEKDARILFAKNFLVNLDELASLSRKEINKLKSYFTLDKINERLPYDRKNSIIPRVASFIGSTNMSTFLQDETGSVRWLCFIIKSINWNYKTEFDINNLWAQAHALSTDKGFDSEMSRDDIRSNELRNAKFQIVSPETDLIREHFEAANVTDGAEFLTSTGILHYLNLQIVGIRLSSVGIGKALTSNGYLRSKHNGIYGYWIKKITASHF